MEKTKRYPYTENFLRAISMKDSKAIISILEKLKSENKNVFFYIDDIGGSSFEHIVREAPVDVIDYLLEKDLFKLDTLVSYTSGDYLAHVLLERKLFEQYKKLHVMHPNLSTISNTDGETPFFKTIDIPGEKFEKYFDYFLDAGMDVSHTNTMDVSLLHLMAQDKSKNHLFIKLLEKGYNCKNKDKMGYTPLDYAYAGDNIDLIDTILYDQSDKVDPVSFISSAISYSDLDPVMSILKNNDLYNNPTKKINQAITPLGEKCIENGELEILNELIQIKSPLMDGSIKSIFCKAISYSDLDAMEMLYDMHKDSLTKRINKDFIFLQLACMSGNKDVYDFVCDSFDFSAINRFAPESKSSISRFPPIALAVYSKNISIVEDLISRTDEPQHMVDLYNSETNPLFIAIKENNLAIAEYLLDKDFYVMQGDLLNLISSKEDENVNMEKLKDFAALNSFNLSNLSSSIVSKEEESPKEEVLQRIQMRFNW